MLLVLAGCAGWDALRGDGSTAADDAAGEGAQAERALLTDTRQLTFAGRRSGEGYFSADGRWMVFQSEREPGNPFYQIYLMDLARGGLHRVSPGVGKTTCGWIHPGGEQVLFASTHLDPDARDEQARELAERAEGRQRRYAWDFDPSYDLFSAPLDAVRADDPDRPPPLERLTHARGYDAEASWSPDGREIVFASNRHAYAPGAEVDAEQLERDPSHFLDLYVMDTRSREVRRLTDQPGYDGGPFFSPDGERIVWRRFSPDGAIAEIHTMARDGSDVRAITALEAMSWAPFYHPSGDYVIFTTNLHGYDDFELYLVDAEGEHPPVRVTHTMGFDGLPVFTPDGDELVWTSTRTSDGQAQLFRARWNDARARALLGLPALAETRAAPSLPLPERTRSTIEEADLRAHVAALSSDTTEGRLTGTPGERIATSYVARAFRRIGLAPAGDGGSWFQTFGFTAGISLGPDNELRIERDGGAADADPAPLVDRDWRPFAFSREGELPASGVVHAGYGIVAPAGGGEPAVDAYAGLDVTDKWVLVFRYQPEELTPAARQHLHRYSGLRYKAMLARDRGARGILVVSGPNSKVREQLAPLRFDVSLAGSSIGALSITDALAERLLAGSGESLQSLQDRADEGGAGIGMELPGVRVAARVDLEQQRREGRNVLGRLQVGARPSADVVVIGAHVDHLGHGDGGSSLALPEERGRIHPGADDNSSGVAVLLEAAEWLAARRRAGLLGARRDVVFAAWSGEELGLLGSSWWVDHAANPHAADASLGEQVFAYLNMDMVGRLDDGVSLFGLSSSTEWPGIIETRAVTADVAVLPQQDSYLPTDATPFYMHGVPILSAFTGAHSEYHTPRDVPETLDYAGMRAIAELMAGFAADLAARETRPTFVAAKAPAAGGSRSGLRVFLGTIPDYAKTDVRGVRLSGVASGGPAERGGMRAGDVVVEVAGRAVENIYDYTYALDALRVEEPVSVVVERDGERIELTVVPASRE